MTVYPRTTGQQSKQFNILKLHEISSQLNFGKKVLQLQAENLCYTVNSTQVSTDNLCQILCKQIDEH